MRRGEVDPKEALKTEMEKIIKPTEIQPQQITSHPVVEPSVMQHKLPLDFGRDFGCAAQSLERLVAELRVQDDESRVVGQEQFGLEVHMGWRGRSFEEGVDRCLKDPVNATLET